MLLGCVYNTPSIGRLNKTSSSPSWLGVGFRVGVEKGTIRNTSSLKGDVSDKARPNMNGVSNVSSIGVTFHH